MVLIRILYDLENQRNLVCRPLPPSDNKGKDLAVIKQILH